MKKSCEVKNQKPLLRSWVLARLDAESHLHNQFVRSRA